MNIFKRFSFITLVLLLTGLGVYINSTKVSAFEVREDKNVTKDEIINGDLFITGENVKVEGTVTGNLFAAGSTVTVSGDVTGNAFVAGSTISVTGDVSKTLYVGGQFVNLAGMIGRDLFVGASQTTVSGKVFEDAFIGAGDATINNDIVGNLYAGSGNLNLDGTVWKNAYVSTSKTDITTAKVKGELALDIQEEVKVDTTVKTDVDWGSKILGYVFKLAFLSGMYLLALVLYKYFPVMLNGIQDEAKRSFLKSLGIGALVVFASFPIIVFAIVSVVGVPFSMLYVAILSAVSFINVIVTGRFVGKGVFKLFKKEASLPVELLVGMLITALVFEIPFIGFFAKSVSYVVILGALLSTKQKSI